MKTLKISFLFLLIFCALIVGGGIETCPVFACPQCRLSSDRDTLIFEPKGKVPQNSQGLVLWGITFRNENAITRNPEIKILNSQGLDVPFEIENVKSENRLSLWLIRPKGGFKLGESYTFINREPLRGIQEFKVEIGSPIPKPTSNKAELLLKPQKMGTVNSPRSCYDRELAASLYPVEMVLPKNIAAFKNELYFETIIDGSESWYYTDSYCSLKEPGASWRGKGVDEIVFFCDKKDRGRYSLKPGKHTVQMRASLPGTDIQVNTEPKWIELKCP